MKNKIDFKKVLITSLFSLIGIIVIAILGFIIYLYFFTSDSVPNFFPFDDKDATYTIVKNEEYFFVHYKSSSDRNKFIDCTKRNGKPVCKELVRNDETIMVGSSVADLSKYIGKNIIITGNFDSARKQCMKDKCIDFAGPWAVVNIASIEEL